MRGNAHVRFGGRAGETERPRGRHRASVRPYYLGVGTEVEHSCLLVVIGARADGRKELLAMELGYRESTTSWADVLRDLRDRGLDGADARGRRRRPGAVGRAPRGVPRDGATSAAGTTRR